MGPGKNQAGRLGWGFLLSFPSGYHTAGAIDQIQEGGCGEGGAGHRSGRGGARTAEQLASPPGASVCCL